MSVVLEIQDGSPWYLSPNIWTVPGNDPEGAPGTPVVGNPCYMWARVRNTGSTAVSNAQVRFYWANPSVGFDRTTANFIGSANVTLAAGETRDVLCLTPWVPVYVNSGHECVLAEVFHSTADPLPMNPAFNVPTDRHVAQRNLSVALAMKMMFSSSFQICNPGRTPQTFRISARHGRLQELKPLERHYERGKIPFEAKGALKDIGFVTRPQTSETDYGHALKAVEKFEVAPHACSGLTVIGRLEGEAALLHIVQEVDGKEVGGLSIVVRSGDNTDTGKERH